MNERQDPDRPDHTADDDAWRDLVARLRDGGPEPVRPGPPPTEPSAAERAATLASEPKGSADGRPEADTRFSEFDPLGIAGPDRGHAEPPRHRGPVGQQDDELLPGAFIPEEPDPVLAGADPLAVLAWVGALGGPIGLLACALAWRSVPGYVIALLVAAFIAGVGVLVMRLPRHKDDGDDGAVV